MDGKKVIKFNGGVKGGVRIIYQALSDLNPGEQEWLKFCVKSNISFVYI